MPSTRGRRSHERGRPLLDVRDLRGCLPAERRGISSPSKAYPFRSRGGARLAIVGESGSGKSVTALSILRLLPPAAHVSGSAFSSRARNSEMRREAAARDPRQCRHHGIPGADDLAQSAAYDRAADRRDSRASRHAQAPANAAAHHRTAARKSAFPIRAAALGLSAPALGRPAPARHDRHGARQPARSLHRRRADDRARRHRAGADPQAAEGFAEPSRHGHAVHHA